MLFSGKDGKECRLCGEWKKYSEFSKRKEAKDGYRTECKSCRSIRNGEYNRKIKQKSTMTTLIVPDMQFPYAHPDVFHFLEAVKHKFAPDEVVSGGDELDLYSLNDYGRDPNHDNPEGEFTKAFECMQKFFKIFPKGVGVTSNHVHGRIERKRHGARFLKQWMRTFEEMIDAPKEWKWVDEYETQGTLIRHGHADGKSGKANLEKINKFRMFTNEKPLSMLLNHHHTELWSQDIPMGQHIAQFGFCGSLVDRKAPAFRYTNKPPALGCMLIRDGRHFPVVMYVDNDNRWVGEL